MLQKNEKVFLILFRAGVGVIESTWISSYPAWYTARRICCTNASLVGGIPSTLWPRFVKSFRRQSLTSSTVETLPYRRHVNISMTRTLSLCGSKLWHGFEYLGNNGVASSNTCHVAYAVNFPPKAETVSQPVKVYQKSSLSHLFPKTIAKLWDRIQRLSIPAQNSTHSCFSIVEAKPSKQEMAMTITSISTVATVITPWHWLTRSLLCTKILVSRSSWLHGVSWVLLSSDLLRGPGYLWLWQVLWNLFLWPVPLLANKTAPSCCFLHAEKTSSFREEGFS